MVETRVFCVPDRCFTPEPLPSPRAVVTHKHHAHIHKHTHKHYDTHTRTPAVGSGNQVICQESSEYKVVKTGECLWVHRCPCRKKEKSGRRATESIRIRACI